MFARLPGVMTYKIMKARCGRFSTSLKKFGEKIFLAFFFSKIAIVMKLDAGSFRYLTKEEGRILTAVEMGMKNHEYVPEQLVESIAHLRRSGVFGLIQRLMKHSLLCHQDGAYKLTYNGYDCLALRALTNRGFIASIGTRIGVGKESDIHMCRGDSANLVVKLHRLGRISFRAVKSKRDYLQGRSHASWMYLARLAAKKEFEYMQVLHKAGFPVPKPVDHNRHAVLMEYMEGSIPMYQLPNEVSNLEIEKLLDVIFKILLRFAACGLIHGDFNEFNLLIDLKNVEKVTVIDFPQIISVEHPEARMQFDRDVTCIERFFSKRFRIDVKGPSFDEALELFRANKDGPLELFHETDLQDGACEEEDEDDEDHSIPCENNRDDESSSIPCEEDDENHSITCDKETKDSIIQDPRYLLKAKRRLEQRNAPKVSIATPSKGKSHAKPNRQKRGQQSFAAREVRAWKSEGI